MGLSCNTEEDVKLESLAILVEAFLRHLSFCRGKLSMNIDTTKLINLTTIKEISFLILTSSEIKLLNWIPKNPFWRNGGSS